MWHAQSLTSSASSTLRTLPFLRCFLEGQLLSVLGFQLGMRLCLEQEGLTSFNLHSKDITTSRGKVTHSNFDQ